MVVALGCRTFWCPPVGPKVIYLSGQAGNAPTPNGRRCCDRCVGVLQPKQSRGPAHGSRANPEHEPETRTAEIVTEGPTGQFCAESR